MAHLQPDRLRDAMAAAGLDVAALASAAGVRAGFLSDALDGSRRLDAAAMRALAGPLAVDWSTLRCDHPIGRQPACPGCAAPNVLTPAEIADAGRAFTRLLGDARAEGMADVARWPELPAFAAARALVVAIGGDLNLEELAAVGVRQVPADGCDEAELAGLAIRLATYCARGDTDTDELVGLDISGDIPSGLHIAGWDLVRYDDQDLDEYEVVLDEGARHTRSWDRTAAAGTWWLRRPAGVRHAVSRMLISFAEPGEAAVPPRFALALLNNEPPGVLSHGWAQKGRGVSLSAMSRQLGYIVDDDGYPDMQYGPYRVGTGESAQSAAHAVYLGGLVERVFATRKKPAPRYAAAAKQFLGVAADVHRGWNPLPRLALEMSTVAEMLLLGTRTEEVSRQVRIAAGWLGGINDADRNVIHDFAKKVYDAGSAYRHGGTQHTLHRGGTVPHGKHLDMLRAYRLLRRLMLHGLALVVAGESPAELCDRAQRTEAARVRLEEIIAQFYADLALPPRSFPAV